MTGGGRQQAARWDAVDEVRQNVARYSVNGRYIRTSHRYVVRWGQHALVVDDTWRGAPELGQAITTAVTRVKLPRAAAELRRGANLAFGDLNHQREPVLVGEQADGDVRSSRRSLE